MGSLESLVMDAMKLGAAVLLGSPAGLFIGAMITALIRNDKLKILAIIVTSVFVSFAYVAWCGWGLADDPLAKQIAFVCSGLLVTISIGAWFASGHRRHPR